MLELKTKWMTNTLAKKSMMANDCILCNNGTQLFIVGYGKLTSSGKNTYNYIVKDASTQSVVSEGENAYLDALTKLILGYNPKGKGNKERAKISNNLCDEYKRLESNLKKAISAFDDFKVAHNVTTLQDANEAQCKAQMKRRKAHQDARREEVAILKRIATLRKWSKETKRLDLLQALNERLLEM